MKKKYHLSRFTKGSGIDRDIKSEKYYISSCQNRLNSQETTKDWIEIIQAFKKVAIKDIDIQKSQLLLSNLKPFNEKIVVKIGINELIMHEYNIGKKLKNLKGFIKYFCYFECNDDFYEYFTKEEGALCKSAGNSMKIILMPYFPEGDIAHFKWTSESKNIELLRSVLIMACMSLCDAYEKKHIIHGDFHAGNIMLKKTKETSIIYKYGTNETEVINVKTYGYRTWIMDFENSYEFNETNLLRAKADFYFDMKKLFILLPTYITFLNKSGLNALIKEISKMEDNPNPNFPFNRKLLSEIIYKNIY
jgi:serine/threonine protein kinase